jgi:hypothetical protein
MIVMGRAGSGLAPIAEFFQLRLAFWTSFCVWFLCIWLS